MNRAALRTLLFVVGLVSAAFTGACATAEQTDDSTLPASAGSSSGGAVDASIVPSGSSSGGQPSGADSSIVIQPEPTGYLDASDASDAPQGRPKKCDDAGRCTCINIASIGTHGETGSSTGDNGDTSSFTDWLNTESSASVDNYTTKPTLTYDPTNTVDAAAPGELLLNNYDVVILQWLADVPNPGPDAPAKDYWQFSPDEVSALQAWVNSGGGIVAMSGYDPNAGEIGPVNNLLSFTEMQYGATDVLGNCQLFDGGADSLCYCNQGATPLGPPWANTAVGTSITQIGAFHGRSVLTSGADAVVDIQDSTYTYAAHQAVGSGHVVVYTDEWVTYSSQWLTVSGDAGGGVNYSNPYDPCYQRSSGLIFQVPQFWYNVIGYAASAVNCPFTITLPPTLPPIVPRVY
ncbi:MAG: hypothetical protein ABTD50_21915 [Polyangiaceae bacterium]|jgi:hypothetical protein